jgi:hypothetical protein
VRSPNQMVEFSEQIHLGEADEGYPGGKKEYEERAGSHMLKTSCRLTGR